MFLFLCSQDFLSVEVELVDFVAQLLKHVVEHHLPTLVEGRDVQLSDESSSHVVVTHDLLM